VVGGDLGQILVVADDLDSMWRAFQARAPFLEVTNHFQMPFILELIVDLCSIMLC
jgi:hypothetical protein